MSNNRTTGGRPGRTAAIVRAGVERGIQDGGWGGKGGHLDSWTRGTREGHGGQGRHVSSRAAGSSGGGGDGECGAGSENVCYLFGAIYSSSYVRTDLLKPKNGIKVLIFLHSGPGLGLKW